MKKKVIVGMSGGVDSSVTAYLLKEQGYEVIGITMQMWREEEPEGQQADNLTGSDATPVQLRGDDTYQMADDACRVAQQLGIPHHVICCEDLFRGKVIDYFIREYRRGRTPNPCNACNRHVKWESLLACADTLSAEYVATGHYARILQLDNGRFSVCPSAVLRKDQSYALYALTQEQLAHTLFPLGAYDKEEIRRIAQQACLPVAHKHDSQDICFVPDGDYAAFIERSTGVADTPGQFVDEEGHVLGTHRGITHYTIGQRKGLGISAETPLFVKEIRPQTNEVVLCRSTALFSTECIVEEVNYMAQPAVADGTRVTAKLRYAHPGAACTLHPMPDGRIRCVFDEPQRAITPGQAAVFYQEGHILCGGKIL